MDDDFDALLNSALDTMTAQDEALEKEKKAHDAAAQAILNDAMMGGAGGAAGANPMAGMDPEMLQALSGLMGILQKGPDAMENASEEEMAAITAQLQSTLDQLKKHPDLSNEDADQLGDMKKMMEQLRELERGQAAADGEGNPADALSEEEFNARKEELTKMLEAMGSAGGLMGGAGGGGPDLPPFPFAMPPGMMPPNAGSSASAASSSSPAAAANAAGVPLPNVPLSEDEACRQVFEMTLGILQEKDIEQPFAKLKAAYEPWLAANADKLDADERKRFENQYRVASDMCSFFATERVSDVLKEGGSATTEQRAAVLERFGTLMAELHSYGEVPTDLFPENSNAEEGAAKEQ